MNAPEKCKQLVEDLKLFDNVDDRLLYVIDKGKKLPPLDAQYKTEKYRIEGCQSNLWLVPEYRDGRCYFTTDSDAIITKGIASLLVYVYNDATPAEVLEIDPAFLAEGGVTQHLTPNRRNGLANICERIRSFAKSCEE